MKKIIVIIIIVLFSYTNAYAEKNNYNKDVENVMDKINDLLFSCEAGLSQNDLIDLNRKMTVEIKKFNEKHENSIACHNFNNIITFTSGLSEKLYWINELPRTHQSESFSKLLHEICNEIRQNKEAIKANKKFIQTNNNIISNTSENKVDDFTRKLNEIKNKKNNKIISDKLLENLYYNKIIPGITNEENALKLMSRNYDSIRINDDKTKSYLFNSYKPGYPNEITCDQNGNVIHMAIMEEKEYLIKQVIELIGNPDRLGSSYYSNDYKVYIFAAHGMALICNSNGVIFEKQFFKKCSLNEFETTFGKNFPASN